MDLPTHYLFGLAVGLGFFGRWEAALLIGLGALLPNLDREYWYVKPQVYADEQYHRARWHNHLCGRSRLSSKPALRDGHLPSHAPGLVHNRQGPWGRVVLPSDETRQAGDVRRRWETTAPGSKGALYFYQEDPLGIIEHADPDLQERKPVPWRRVYGFAQNRHLLDRGFLFGSLGLIFVWALFPSHYSNETASFSAITSAWMPWAAGYGFVVLLYVAGETERRDVNPKLPWLKPIQKPLLVAGLVGFVAWLVVYSAQIWANLEVVFADPAYVILSTAVVVVVSVLVAYWMSTDGKTTMV